MCRLDCRRHLVNRALGQRVEQPIPTREVVIQGGARHARAARHVLQADARVAGQRLGRRIEDALGVPAGIHAGWFVRKKT